jgi:branched-chain amino acid transport system permease protein
VRAFVGLLFDRPSYVFPDPLPFRRIGHGGFFSVGSASIQARAFFVFGLALALALLSTVVLERTRFGRGLQAIAADADGARIVGVPVNGLIAAAFGIVGGLAALAAVAAAPNGPFDTETGVLLGLKGLAAALVVRFVSPLRAFAAGVALGVVEAAIAGLPLFGHELGAEYREVVPLAAVLLLVAIRPARGALAEQE